MALPPLSSRLSRQKWFRPRAALAVRWSKITAIQERRLYCWKCPVICWEPTREIIIMRWSRRVCQTRTRPARLVLSARHRRSSGFAAPQVPSLRSGLCCPGPSSLTRPHPSYSPTRPNFPVVRVIWLRLLGSAGTFRPVVAVHRQMSRSAPEEKPQTQPKRVIILLMNNKEAGFS
jgi:hypothetical protein